MAYHPPVATVGIGNSSKWGDPGGLVFMKGWRGRGGGRGAVPCRLPLLWLMDRTRIAYLLPTETSAAFVVINTHLLAGHMIEYFRNHTSHKICEIIYIDFHYLVFI